MSTSNECIQLENEYGAHNYHPLPVVLARGQGVLVWDVEGNQYYDFLSAYSAMNQGIALLMKGHCHPRLLKVLTEQASQLTLSSRAFYNNMLGKYSKFITQFFGFEMVLPMNTGAEGVETALKLARKWGYVKKGIPANEALILSVTNNFHGRTIAIISMSSDPDCRDSFGPFMESIGSTCPKTSMNVLIAEQSIRYGVIEDLEAALKVHGDRVAGFLVEPIQGEAGIIVPPEGYLRACYELCKKYNVLFIADEIQSGLARTGKMLAVDHEGVKPDVLILGKALSGGMYPVSAVLSSKEIMLCIKPGEHGSTYGGNPLGCALAIEALSILRDEKMAENAEKLGHIFREELRKIKSPFIKVVRGKGLLNAVVIDDSKGKSAWHLCLIMKKNGLLAKPTHENIIRLAPPLCIDEAQIMACIDIIKRSFADLESITVEQLKMMDK